MSVINQMLRDLDERAANEKERAGLPRQLRTLPPSKRMRQQNLRMLAIGIGVGATVAGAVVALLLRNEPQPPPVISPPSRASALPVTAPAPAPVAVAAPAGVAESVAPGATSEVSRGKEALGSEVGEIKLTPQLASPAQPQPPAVAGQTVPVAEPARVVTPVAVPTVTKPAEPITKPVNAPAASTPAPAKPTTTPLSVKPAVEAPKPAAAAATKPGASLAPASPVETQIDKRTKGVASSEKAESEYQKGMQAVRRNENALATAAFQRALEMEPGMVRARQALLSVLVGGRQWGDAQRVAQAGLALDPMQSGWAMILARLQFEQSDTAGALETLGRHSAYAKSEADYQGFFAYLLQKQSRHAEAVDRFKAALAVRPNEGRWWFGLGLALDAAGREIDARDAFVRARESGNLQGDMSAVVEQKLR